MIGETTTREPGVGRPSLACWTVVVVAYFALAAAMTYPLLMQMSDHVLIIPIDNLHLTWVLAWDYHALGSEPLKLFDANIFYPARHTLALSEHLLGDLPIFAPVMFLTQNPLLAANSVVFASFVLSGVAMFALVWYWTRSAPPSFIAGFIFAFAPPRIGQLGKWHLLSVQWAPLTLLFLERFLRARRWRDGLLASTFYTLQVLSSFYLGYAVTFVIGSYLAYRLLTDPSVRSRDLLFRGLACAVLAAAFILPSTYPYFVARREFGLPLPSPESYTWASTDPALSFLSVTIYGKNIYQGLLARFQSASPWETWLFPGVLPVLLAVVAVRSGIRASRPLPTPRWDSHTVLACLLIILVPLTISLGPALVVNERATGIPMPYALFWHVVPGFAAMRAPARFALMAWVGLSVLAGFGVQVLSCAVADRVGRSALRRRIAEVALTAVLLSLAAAEFWFAPLPTERIETGPEIPSVYRWLAAQPRDGAVLEVPWTIGRESQSNPEWRRRYRFLAEKMPWVDEHMDLLVDWITRARYVYFSVYHWHPVVNGYASYTPPTYEAIVRRLQEFPGVEGVEYLRAIGVRWLIVHRAQLEPADADRWLSLDPAAIGLRRAQGFGQDVVYEIAR